MEKTFKVCGIDHIGIVPKSDKNLQFILEEVLGFSASKEEVVKEQKTKVQKFKVPSARESPALETLSPTDPNSVIQKFQEKKGNGIHHIALRVDALEEAIKTLIANNIKMINPKPMLGAENCKIAFIHPSSTSGILIELIEK